MRYRALGIMVAGLAAMPAAAEVTTGAAFLNLPLSVRQTGMGGVAPGGQDVMRAWSNPAMLAGQRTRGELAIDGASMFGGHESTLAAGAGWVPISPWTIGIFACAYTASLPEVNGAGDRLDTSLDRSLTAGGIAGAFQSGRVRAGMLLKGMTDQVLADRASTVAIDVGWVAALGPFELGAAARNLGLSLDRATGAYAGGVELPVEARGGLAWREPDWHLTVVAEFVQIRGRRARTAAGAEWMTLDRFALRTGFEDAEDITGRFTLGLSASFSDFGLDYAMAAHPIGPSHRLSLTYAFGPAGR
ncbi:MAG: hypothetical protein AAB152_03390 [Candidatus Coatesbacteria bacterium]